MNEVVKTLTNHRSIRSFRNESIDDITLRVITDCAQSAPSSINGQQMSIIIVKDSEKKAIISEACGKQSWIIEAPVFLLFVSDFYRSKLACDKNNIEMQITDSIEASLVGSVDVGLAMGNAIAAAESLGLGIVPIGGVRNNPEVIIDLLNLPDYVYPICGLCLGYPDDTSAKKPRFPHEAVIHEETYNADLMPLVDEFDITIKEYLDKRTGEVQEKNWSKTVSWLYQKVYYPKVLATMRSQKYKNEK